MLEVEFKDSVKYKQNHTKICHVYWTMKKHNSIKVYLKSNFYLIPMPLLWQVGSKCTPFQLDCSPSSIAFVVLCYGTRVVK